MVVGRNFFTTNIIKYSYTTLRCVLILCILSLSLARASRVQLAVEYRPFVLLFVTSKKLATIRFLIVVGHIHAQKVT
jgi:hypothetical protein